MATGDRIQLATMNDITKEKLFETLQTVPVENGGTGKATADEAFGSLGKNFGFPNAKNVGDNTDLNTLTKSGFYFSAGSKNTTNTTNIPQIVYDTIRSYYELNILVFGLANRVTQIAVCPYNNNTELYERMWVRTGTGTSVDSLSWSDWKEIFNSKRYIPIANGGTGAGTADTARTNLNAQRRLPVYVNGDGADLDTDMFDFILTALTTTKHSDLRNLGFGGFAYIWQYFFSDKSNTESRVQFARGYTTNKIATRYYSGNTQSWSAWTSFFTSDDNTLEIGSNRTAGGSVTIDFHTNVNTDYDSRITANTSKAMALIATGGVSVSNVASGSAFVRNIQFSTTDLTAGSSALNNGQIYLVYE